MTQLWNQRFDALDMVLCYYSHNFAMSWTHKISVKVFSHAQS